jgi:hypothetical protein
MKADSPLKKHHFWILCGVVPLFTMIAVLIVDSSVGGRIEARASAIKKERDAIGNKKNPKPISLIKEAGTTVAKVEKRQGKLHEENWERQKDLFTWPANSKLLRPFDQMNLKFGAPLPTEEGEFDEFKKPSVYLYEFSSLLKKDAVGPGTGMADTVAPTQFAGGDWRAVLRHVNDWGQSQITKDQVWLVMEDIWVQRSLLGAVRSVNAQMATFHRARVVKPEKGEKDDKDADGGEIEDDPTYDDAGTKLDAEGNPTATPDAEKLTALFRNRTWAVGLKVVKEGTAYKLTGTLRNLTDRLQLMGVNNTLTLKVWFAKTPQPALFRIAGEYLAGRGAKRLVRVDGKDIEEAADVTTAVPLDSNVLPPGTEPTEIVRIEQVFDVRTVPVKQINALVMGKLDSRSAGQQLVAPKYLPPEPADASAAGAGGKSPGMQPGAPPGMQPGMQPGIQPPMQPGPGGPRGGGGQQAVAGRAFGGGSIQEIADGNKKRYLVSTDQVRRIPVGLVVVVDQSYMEDILLAFANSPLRFQITQVAWMRFAGTLAGAGGGGSAGGRGDDIDFASGSSSIRGPGDPDAAMPPGGRIGRPGKPGLSGPGSIPPRAGPAGSGFPGAAAGGPSGSTVSEAQVTSGLVELSVYGVISLYEKFEPGKADAAASAGTGSGKAPDPAPGSGKAPDPVKPPGPTTTTPKKRRRTRAPR